jgi:hypothetical protein
VSIQGRDNTSVEAPAQSSLDYGRTSEISIFDRLQTIGTPTGPTHDLQAAEYADLLVVANLVETDISLKFQG